jgi:hypothetical protein
MRSCILFIPLLVACAPQSPPSDPRDITGINPAFASYVQEFEVMLGHSIGDIPIQFAAQQGNIVAQCIIWDHQWREIKVDPSFWQYGATDDEQRESIIAHELGHCVLNRAHIATDFIYTDSNNMSFNTPTSLMNPYIFFSSLWPDWQALKIYYYNELFHPAPGYPTLGISQSLSDEDFIQMETPHATK